MKLDKNMPQEKNHLVIISGGQTGVDRAALDAALAAELSLDGWCPRGRRAEDGRLDEVYPLRETATAFYQERTRFNIRDSDATLIITPEPKNPTGGTALTVNLCVTLCKPMLIITPDYSELNLTLQWLYTHNVARLNIAGPRESSNRGIYRLSYDVLAELFIAYVNGQHEYECCETIAAYKHIQKIRRV
ncbi:MAG: putative molybdenum carrier protein [Mariprofundales bacterium]